MAGIGKKAFYAQIDLDEHGAYELTKDGDGVERASSTTRRRASARSWASASRPGATGSVTPATRSPSRSSRRCSSSSDRRTSSPSGSASRRRRATDLPRSRRRCASASRARCRRRGSRRRPRRLSAAEHARSCSRRTSACRCAGAVLVAINTRLLRGRGRVHPAAFGREDPRRGHRAPGRWPRSVELPGARGGRRGRRRGLGAPAGTTPYAELLARGRRRPARRGGSTTRSA